MQRQNLTLLRKDPLKERREYYLSIMGREFVDTHSDDFQHLIKNKDNIGFKLYDIQKAFDDIQMLQKEQSENNQKAFT